MKAVVYSSGKLEVTDVPTPRPDSGHVLLDVSRCGICGSDLQARVHSDHLAVVFATVGLGGVEAAFNALGDPGGHAEILVDPAGAVTVV